MRPARLFGIAGSILLASGTLAACGGGSSSGSSDEVVIGLAQPISGPVASAGQAVVQGAQIAIKQINDGGGVDGRKLKLVVEDNANDPATCVSVAQRMAQKVQASAVIGGWGSSCTLAMQPVLERAGVPLVVETSSSDKITDPKVSGSEWTFRMSPAASMEAVATAPILAKMGVKKVFTMSVNNDFGLGTAASYEKALPGVGVDVVGGVKFDQSEQSFSTFVTKAKASGADTWVVTTDVGQIALLLKEAKGQGADARIVTAGGSNNPIQVIDLAGKAAAENTYANVFYPWFDPSLSANPKDAKRFNQAWSAAGHPLGEITEGVRGYQAVKVVAAAVGKAKDPTDRKSLRDALAGIDLAGAAYGNISFGKWNGLENQVVPPVFLVKTTGGKVKLQGVRKPPY